MSAGSKTISDGRREDSFQAALRQQRTLMVAIKTEVEGASAVARSRFCYQVHLDAG
ncbi:hypothetical protein IHQ68_13280 [Chelatococcus sambhunathii]|uniref:Uncharacterized protein n=1 Tax=Chelatococcus sambhunathii TaxID=363953 RepID=A0ABU1DHK2_9HYPH|nr:hypothetical protein [Chelatococcus sambhunathii]MDR4307591.1 hypothetical protein [Chelatococcus sambhunathii]